MTTNDCPSSRTSTCLARFLGRNYEGLSRIGCSLNSLELRLPPSDGFCEDLSLLAPSERPAIDYVVIDRGLGLVRALFASPQIDLNSTQLNRNALACTGLVLLDNGVPLFVDERPKDQRFRPLRLQVCPP